MVSVTENGENMRDSAAIGLSVAGSVATVLSRYFFLCLVFAWDF